MQLTRPTAIERANYTFRYVCRSVRAKPISRNLQGTKASAVVHEESDSRVLLLKTRLSLRARDPLISRCLVRAVLSTSFYLRLRSPHDSFHDSICSVCVSFLCLFVAEARIKISRSIMISSLPLIPRETIGQSFIYTLVQIIYTNIILKFIIIVKFINYLNLGTETKYIRCVGYTKYYFIPFENTRPTLRITNPNDGIPLVFTID